MVDHRRTAPGVVLVDLDNTLVDRAGAFAAWASAFTSDRGLGPDAASWLVEADGDGYTPRAVLAERMRARFHLSDDVPHLVERLLFEHLPWVAHGRAWTEERVPDVVRGSTIEVLDALLDVSREARPG